MAYSLDSLQDGCYENSTVLINKFDIRNEKVLDELEQGITSALIAKASLKIPFKNVDFNFYKNLHKFVFGDIYDWAGTIRTVNISKNTTGFCPYEKIDEVGKNIFKRFIKANYLKDLSQDTFIDEFTTLYCDLNYLHAFREGNGRIQRLFLTMLLNHLDHSIDWSEIDSDLLMIATIKSVSGDVFMLRDIFKENIHFNV